MHKRQQIRARIPNFVSIVNHHWQGCYSTITSVSYSIQPALVLVNASTIACWAQRLMLFSMKTVEFTCNVSLKRISTCGAMTSVPLIDFNHCFGLSRLRSNVFRAFMTPAPVPSAVIDHTLIYGLMKADVCSRAKGSSSFPTCRKQANFSQRLGFTSYLHILLCAHCCIPQQCTTAMHHSATTH